MPTRRQFLALAGSVALAGCGGDAGGATTSATTTGPTPPLESTTAGTGKAMMSTTVDDDSFALSTSAFEDGGTIPSRYTADGADVSPPLAIEGVPTETETLALVVDDPDAPGGTFVHWLLWNVPASTTRIEADVPQTETVGRLDGARQGTNGFGELGYRGPKPPRSDGAHTYRFTLHAVDATRDVAAGARRDALSGTLADHTLAKTGLTGEYERN